MTGQVEELTGRVFPDKGKPRVTLGRKATVSAKNSGEAALPKRRESGKPLSLFEGFFVF